jgi:hypothetical protein
MVPLSGAFVTPASTNYLYSWLFGVLLFRLLTVAVFVHSCSLYCKRALRNTCFCITGYLQVYKYICNTERKR